MRLLPAEFAPDRGILSSGVTHWVNNVVAIGPVEYGPIGTLTPVSNALGSRCQGAASFRAADRTVFNTAGDEEDLYDYDPSGATFTAISRLAGGPYATAIDDFWSFANYGSLAFAANGTDALQSIDIVLDTEYAAAAGSPPVARFVVICREFVVLGRLDSGVNRICWSGIGAPTFWTFGLQQSDEQIFADGGQVMGLVGGQGLIVFLEGRIILGTYVGPGQIFQFDSISTDRGCAASMSIAPWQDRVFFLSHDGFYMLTGGGLTPIGSLRVDNSFWKGSEGLPAVHPDYIYRTIGCVDPVKKLYLVAYASTNSADGTPDTVASYAWEAGPAGRWARANIDIEFMYRARINAGMTLEDLDVPYPDLDAMDVSLDSNLFAGSPQETLALFGTDHKLGFLSGANMLAEVDTQEGELSPGEKIKVDSVRAHVAGGTDAEDIEVSVGKRKNKLNDPIEWSSFVTQRETGFSRFTAKRTKGRVHKARVRLAAGAVWNTFEGVDVAAQGAGGR